MDDKVKTDKNLSHKVRSEVAMTSIFQVMGMIIDLAYMAILSRILSPADFGIVAAATLFLSICNILREVGIGTTIIQMSSVSVSDQRTGLTLVLTSSALLVMLAQVMAGPFANFLNMPEAVDVVRVMSGMILIQGLATVSEGLLLRRLEMRKLRIAEIAAKTVAYGTAGLGLAWLGYGYWALVIAMMVEAGLRSLTFVILARPPLLPGLSADSARRLLGTGGGFTLTRIINFIALRADVTIIGRYMDATSLGLYSRAYKLMSLPSDLYTRVIDKVAFPAMAKVQSSPERLQNAFLRGAALTAFMGMPLSVALFVLAPELVALLLGSQWSAVVPVFSVLAMGTYFRLGAKVSESVLRATASIRFLIAGQCIYAALTVGGSLALVRYGLTAVGAGVGLAIFLYYSFLTFQACRMTGTSFRQLLSAHLHGFMLSLLAAATTYGIAYWPRSVGMNSLVILGLEGIGAIIIGALLLALKPRFLLGPEGIKLFEMITGGLGKLRRRPTA